MNKKFLFIGCAIVLVVGLVLLVKTTTANIETVFQSEYSTISNCTSVDDSVTITCGCSIIINNKNYEINNTINAVSCSNSVDLCSNLCRMFVEDLQNK